MLLSITYPLVTRIPANQNNVPNYIIKLIHTSLILFCHSAGQQHGRVISPPHRGRPGDDTHFRDQILRITVSVEFSNSVSISSNSHSISSTLNDFEDIVVSIMRPRTQLMCFRFTVIQMYVKDKNKHFK